MPVTTIGGHDIHVDDEGFPTARAPAASSPSSAPKATWTWPTQAWSWPTPPSAKVSRRTEAGVPRVPESLDQIVAACGHLWACRTSADVMHLDQDDLYEGVEDIINAADFIEKTDGAQLLFV
jgi:DsrE/DsrF/DrsH-like protein